MTITDKKQEEFNELFLEKNKELDKLIEKEWNEVFYGNEMKKFYKDEVDNIFNIELEDKTFDFYWGDDERFVLSFDRKDDNTKLGIYDTLHIWHREETSSYEHQYIELEIYETFYASKELESNDLKIKYTEEKLEFLELTKKYKNKIVDLIKEELDSRNIDKDLERLKAIDFSIS